MASPGQDDPNFQNTGARPKTSQVSDSETSNPNPLQGQGQTGEAPNTNTDAAATGSTDVTVKFDEIDFMRQFSQFNINPTDSMESRNLKKSMADVLVAQEKKRRQELVDRKRMQDQQDQIAQMAAQMQALQAQAQQATAAAAAAVAIPPPNQFLQPPPALNPPAMPAQLFQPASASFTVTLAQPPVVNNLTNSGNLSINSQNFSQNITMSTPQEEHINTRRQLLDNEYQSLVLQAQSLDLMFHNLANAAVPPTQTQVTSYNALNDRVKKGLADIDAKRTALDNTKAVAESFKTSLRMPNLALTEANYTDALRKKLEGKNVTSSIRKFNPDKDPEADFTDTWNHILLYTKDFTLTCSSYLDLLLLLMEGSAYRSLMDMMNSKASLSEILKTMCSLYSKRKTMLDLIQSINDFTRYPHEIIEKTMSRAAIVIDKVKDNFPPAEWLSNKDRMLQSILSQVISKATKAHLDAEERKCLRVGAKLSYQSKLDTVDAFEHANGELPRHSVATVINACTGTPIDSKLNFDGNQSTYSVNAAVPRDKRIKSKSRERRISGTRDRAAHTREAVSTPLPADDWDMDIPQDVQSRQRAQVAMYDRFNQHAREKSIDKSRPKSPFKKSIRSLSRNRYRSSGRGRSNSKPRQPQHASQSQSSDSYSQGLPGNQEAFRQAYQQQQMQQQSAVQQQHLPVAQPQPQTAPAVLPQYVPHPSQVHPNNNYAPQQYYSHGSDQRPRSSSAGKRGYYHASRSRTRDDRDAYYRYRSGERRRSHSKSPGRFYEDRRRAQSKSPFRHYPNPYYPHAFPPLPYIGQGYYQNQPSQGSSGKNSKRRSRDKVKNPNPKVTDEGNSKKISFSQGKVDIYLCNNGCEGSYHTTQTCPRIQKSLN